MKLDCNSSKWILPTQSCHIRSLLSASFLHHLTTPPQPKFTHTPTPLPKPAHGGIPIRVFCCVNNKSCVTLQITQTAYHLFIVLYHNNYLVRTKATGSQTSAFVNELGRLPELKINCQCWRFRPARVCIPASPLFTPWRKDRDCSWREQTPFKLNWMSAYTGIFGTLYWCLVTTERLSIICITLGLQRHFYNKNDPNFPKLKKNT